MIISVQKRTSSSVEVPQAFPDWSHTHYLKGTVKLCSPDFSSQLLPLNSVTHSRPCVGQFAKNIALKISSVNPYFCIILLLNYAKKNVSCKPSQTTLWYEVSVPVQKNLWHNHVWKALSYLLFKFSLCYIICFLFQFGKNGI